MSTGKTYYGIAMGDPAGIGPEIALKAVNRSTANRNSVIIYGSEVVLRQCHQQLGIEAPLKVITQPGEFEKGCINMIAAASIDADEVVVGQASAATGQAARASIARAVQDALAGKIGVVTTAPVSMPAIAAGTDDVNSLETLFASMTHTASTATMMWCPYFAAIHASTGSSVLAACHNVTRQRILECIRLANEIMQKLGKEVPALAVAGLNPYAGDAGMLGHEEIDEIRPAVAAAQAEGLTVSGPVTPDRVFLQAYQGLFDAVVDMYQDQGNIPLKLAAIDRAVEVTLGLPVICTTVAHGPALDIAGMGIAREESLLCALDLGMRIFEVSQ